MTRKTRMKVDPLEQKITLALQPETFISDRSCYSFVSDLEMVADRIARLIDTDPTRAVALYETFLAGCFEKAEEVDDSSGSFGGHVQDLFCGWIRARQATRSDPEETAARLLGWLDDDPYGFAYQLEKEAAKILNKAGRAALVKQIRARFDGTARPGAEGSTIIATLSATRRQWGEALRPLYLAQRDLDAYVALAEDTGLTAQDCLVIATMLVVRRKPEEALAWVERGIALDQEKQFGSLAGGDLVKLKRDILTKLDRGGEALDTAWAEFQKTPHKLSYDNLMKLVPKTERTRWHEKAIATAIEAAGGLNLYSIMELLLETKEIERLAELVRRSTDSDLEILSHFTTEPVAKKLEKSHPDIAARLWRAQGMRIINAKKSKYYHAALSNFENAKRCFKRAGLADEWEKTVSLVRADHSRKAGFMSDFERLTSGEGPSRDLSLY